MTMAQKTPAPTVAAVAAVFHTYPPAARKKLLVLRELIFKTAASMKEVGDISETLKWGEPAYVTEETGSGSTIRIAWNKKSPNQYAMYFNCNTTLVESFRTLLPDVFRFAGNRAIIWHLDDVVDTASLTNCIEHALTYHLKT
jgi:Domain of unknown function (DU1801)